MSIPVKNPTFLAGTPRSSGDVQTGELQHVRGGGRAVTFMSGLPLGDSMIFSGAGRLNSILQHTQMASGLAVVLYDGALATSGGPFGLSGHKVIGIVPPTWAGGVQGSGSTTVFTGQPVNVDMPFQSGLLVNLRSGQPGFTVSFTPEVDLNFPNA